MMIDGLSNRTLMLVAGVMYVLLPLSVWVVLRRPRQAAPALWCAGGVLGGIGLLLMGLRGGIPDFLSYVVGQPLIALAAIMLAQSLRLDLGRPWPVDRIALFVLVYTGVLWTMIEFRIDTLLDELIRSVNLVVVSLIAVAAWQVGRAERSRNALLIAAAYAIQAAGVLGNLVNSFQGSLDLRTLSGSRVGVVVGLLTLLVSLLSAMGYLGLALERMARREVESARELARARQWHERREALVRLDRERLLSVLADSLAQQILQPLTAALLRVQAGQRQLAQASPDPARQLEWIEHGIHNIRRASAIVDRVRGLIRPLPLQARPVDMQALLRDVEQLLRQEAIIRQVDVRFSLGAEPALVTGDPLELCQAVLQAARNAIAAVAGQARRKVLVALVAAGPQVWVRITDSGPGFSDEALRPAAGQRVPRLQSLQGIGLFVVQSIVERHQGVLQVEASSTGGVVVTMDFPRAGVATNLAGVGDG